MLHPSRLETECLSNELLTNYLAGLLPEDSATQVEQHLSQCTECDDLMQQIESNGSCDELLRPIQASADSALVNSQEIPVVCSRPWLPWISSREIGPYELIEPLGHGGMGLVYLARHRKLDRLVAIKLLPAHHQTAEARVRFEREILAAGRLQHPAIVSATDAGQFGDMDYLVMEYVRGLDLGRLCKSIPILRFEEVCEIGRQIAIGLSYAHAQGFVHRDIKPSNIILDDNGIVKILDFGLVLFDRWDGVSSELTTVGQFLGTLDYMAPEQAERCGSVDFRADLYALGATLFKLLCGRAPLAAAPNQSPIDKLRLLATHRPPSLKTLRPDAPEPLCQLVDSMLSTVPQSRPASAAHVAEDLQLQTKPGCLMDLIARARVAEADANHVKSSPAELKIQSRSDSNQVNSVHSSTASSGNGNRWLYWIAAAMVPLAFLTGYIIQLSTPDGQFIVESEIDGAQLKIVKAGAETKSLKIETGNSVTKLSAGKYEVTLDSPSDGVTIDRDSFVIERGKVVIARIRKGPIAMPTGNIVQPSTTVADSKVTNATYEGKSLAEWLDVARREKEPKSWRVAMDALNTLTDEDQKKGLFEEVFQLCLSNGDFSAAYGWGVELLFTDRIAHEMESASQDRRLQLAKLAGENFSEKDLNPIWKWLESNVEQDPEGTNQLTSSVLDLTTIGVRRRQGMPLSDIGSIVYLAKNFPRLATLFDDYLLYRWDNSFSNPPLFLHIRGIALKRLEAFDGGFASNVAALAIVLERASSKNGNYHELSAEEKELVCRRTVELISAAWENRETPFMASWAIPTGMQRLGRPGGFYEDFNANRKKLSVPRLLNTLDSFLQQLQTDAVAQTRILDALANLEQESREDATKATAELPKDLKEIKLSDAFFFASDFRLAEKIDLGQNNIVYQMPSNLSAERRAKFDERCFAYNLHRYVSLLLWGLNSSHQAYSPIEIGTRLSAFRMLDSNQDWRLTRDEWVPGFETRMASPTQKIRISEFSVILSLEELAKLHQSEESFLRLDLDKDHRLSLEEAIGLDDFSGADRNSDGFLTFGEYGMRGVQIGQPIQPQGQPSIQPQGQPSRATTADERMREWAAGAMKRKDKDNNGFLTADEFNDDAKFPKVDINKDGKIDVNEYMNSRK